MAVSAQLLYVMAQKAHSEREKRGIDPAVPGVSNYYNLNPKARKKLWEEYKAGLGGVPEAQSPGLPLEAVYDGSTAAFPPEAQGSPNVRRTGAAPRRGRKRPRMVYDAHDDPAAALAPETPGLPYPSPYPVNDLIVTPQGQFSTHPDDYILAMKNPSALVNNEIRNEVRSVERVPHAPTPVIVEGEIQLMSELVIDDKGYQLRQQVGKNTTPYKFAVGNVENARMI
jgi:hypothetical protein